MTKLHPRLCLCFLLTLVSLPVLAQQFLPQLTRIDESDANINLDGFVDEADEAVYLEAERIFQRDLRRYGVRPRRSPALDARG